MTAIRSRTARLLGASTIAVSLSLGVAACGNDAEDLGTTLADLILLLVEEGLGADFYDEEFRFFQEGPYIAATDGSLLDEE